MTDTRSAYSIIEANPKLTELDDLLSQKVFRPISDREVAPRQKYFVTGPLDESARLAITGKDAFTDDQEVFLEYRPTDKGLLLAVTGDFMPGNPRFKKVESDKAGAVRYETHVTDVKDIDDELISWVHASYDSFIPEDTRTLDEKKKEWEEKNKSCLAEAFSGGPYGSEYGYEAIALASVVFGKDSIEWADSNKNIALVYLYKGYADSALKYSNFAYPIAEKLLDKHFETAAEILHQHAAVLQANKAYKEAEELYKRVLNLREKDKTISQTTIAQSLGDLARLYAETERSDEAEETNLRCLDIYQKFMKTCKDTQSDEYYSALYNHTIIRSNIAMNQRINKHYKESTVAYNSLADALEEIVKLGGQPQESLLKNIHANMLALEKEYPEAKAKLASAQAKIEKMIPEEERSDYWQAIDYLLNEFGRKHE